MSTTHLASRITPFQEVTAGVPPASAVAWASETSMRHRSGSLDLTELKQSMIEDERSQLNITDDEPMIAGIAGGGDVSVPCDFDMHGTGQTPADGSPITEDLLSTFIEHCFGGMALGTTDALVAAGAHSTTDIELTDTLPAGTWVGLDDSSGITHLRRVESSSAGGVGVIHVLHRALPFTPADGALARGCAVYYLDEDILEDSQLGPYLFSWLYELGRGSQRQTWQTMACKSSITGFSLARNEVGMFSTVTKVGSFLTPQDAPVPTWAANPTGSAGSAVGPRTEIWLQTRGTTTDATVQVDSFELDPGIVSNPVPTQTEDGTNMPGLYGYTLGKNPCTVAMNIIPHADTPLADFAARTEKSVQWERQAAAGSAWSIYLPRCTHDDGPAPADVSTMLGQSVKLRAHYDDDQSTAIARSRIQVIRC